MALIRSPSGQNSRSCDDSTLTLNRRLLAACSARTLHGKQRSSGSTVRPAFRGLYRNADSSHLKRALEG